VGYYIWRLIWSAAFVLLGLVIYGLFPRFAVETVEAGEHYGAAFDWVSWSPLDCSSQR